MTTTLAISGSPEAHVNTIPIPLQGLVTSECGGAHPIHLCQSSNRQDSKHEPRFCISIITTCGSFLQLHAMLSASPSTCRCTCHTHAYTLRSSAPQRP
jgi:hypothetical protein